ncbi:MAG: phosphatidylglycerophosphatase A [Methanobacterium sp.]|nr:phosphatidylglycerophosphatase A [Methanobacterium sp.]
MRDNNLSGSIYDFMSAAGVEVPQLVEAGLELLVGVEKSREFEIKLESQIRKSLQDINVIVLIMAGIRVEEDLFNHRIEGVDVDDDPAYLYSDEVLGMAIANQIAGTKAIFNFKRYDEAKPGIIGTLGPMLDDVFAGLVAGCMSKIFEE